MSIVSNTHDVVNYDPKKSSAFTGQRLAKITYKTDKESGTKKDSKCVSIPMVASEAITASIDKLMPHLVTYMQDVQDKIIRGLVDSGKETVHDDEISVAACIEFLDSESTGGRLTKEMISSWFDSTLADKLTVAFADKLGVSDTPTADDEAKITAAITQYKDKFSSLAGGKTSYSPEIADRLQKALSFAPDGDELAGKFSVRLEKMKEIPAIDLLGL